MCVCVRVCVCVCIIYVYICVCIYMYVCGLCVRSGERQRVLLTSGPWLLPGRRSRAEHHAGPEPGCGHASRKPAAL